MSHNNAALANNHDLREKLLISRQYAAVVTAFMLPISTSGQAIAVSVLALLALLTLDHTRLADTMRNPAAYLPLVLFGFIMVGVLWSLQPLGPALRWVGPYAKLLLIPLLMATAFTPKQAMQICCGFVASCMILLTLSYVSLLWPSGPWGWLKAPGIPVKDNAIQSECFALCAFGLAMGGIRTMRQGDRRRATLMFVLALLFFCNIFLIVLSKTGMIAAAAIFVLFLIEVGGWKRVIAVAATALLLIAVSFWASPSAQQRLAEISIDVKAGNDGARETNSTASRRDFWIKAYGFLREAPVFGHGTGSIKPLYQSLEAIRPSPYGEAVPDPHNQFLHTSLQIGLAGGLVLLAMWAMHFRMFLGRDMASVAALAVVVQNIVGSLFNSHISQITQGMTYCLAVGILGAVVRGPPPSPKRPIATPWDEIAIEPLVIAKSSSS